ncbi:MAG: cytochrome c [Gammaproteobacteria bacterium]|nr:cytochrome c [Gammaproteobacteria bacterium]
MQKTRFRFLVAALAITTGPAASLVATAETTSQDAADYRESVMTSLKGHIGAASMHVRGLVDGPEFLLKHARGLANGASEIATLFPAGSNVEGSEALPVIWEQPEEFAAAVEKLVDATKKFVAAAERDDKPAIAAAFRDVGGSCKGCHDKFRAPKD